MDKFTLHFDYRPYANLDKFALMARQDYNLGNSDRWFQCFRRGYLGFIARLKGIEIHYENIHAWGHVNTQQQILIEYHLASIFFNMDSSFECLVFALNSLGYAINPADFVCISDERELRRISPFNIFGNAKNQVIGYDQYFVHTKEYICANKALIETIIEQHDVSKHRQSIFEGGKCRFDPPESFFEEQNIEDNAQNRVLYAPFSIINLMPEPKTPESKRKTIPFKEKLILEDIGPKFCNFINELGYKALNDVQMNITPSL